MDNNQLSQQPYLSFFNADTAEYDVIVDQSSSAPNLKEATWGALQPLMPLIADRMGPEEFGLVLEYAPLPESFLEKFQAIVDQKAQQPPPPDPAMQKIQADQQAKQAELQMRQQESQVQMQIDLQKNQQQQQMDLQTTQAELALEREKAAAEIQLEREKAAAQLDLERQRMAFEVEKVKAQFALEQHKTAMQMQADQQRAQFDQQRFQTETGMKQKAMTHELRLKAGLAGVKMAQGGADQADGADAADGEDMQDVLGLKALADAMAQMAQSQADSNRMLAESVQALQQALTKPKTIVRGPDGRAVGVQ